MNISTLNKLIEDYNAQQQLVKSPNNLYEPIDYLMNTSGKRIRPLLCLLAYRLYHNDASEVLPVAYAVEMFHNFTLMHDDIMDDATLRRGVLTVHQKYNTNTAILSGDVMLLVAYRYLLQAGLNVEDITLFNDTAIQICEGQQMDMDFEDRTNVSIEEYLEMIRLKTAVLLGLSLQLGGIKAGASAKDLKHLYLFGVNMGIAFQLHDDMLDAYGESVKVGKKQGGDILQKKQTYLHLKTMELLEGKDKNDYLEVFNGTTLSDKERIDTVMKYYNQTVVKEYSNQSEEAYFTLAMSHLDAISVDREHKQNLRLLSKQLMERDR